MAKKVKFFEVMSRLNEGDVVLFKTEKTVSKIQRLLCNSEYDHVGLVVAWDHCEEECCSSRLKQARKSAGAKAWHTLEVDGESGVQLHRLTPACLKSYRGSAVVRHLDLSGISDAQYALACASLHSFVKAILGAPYDCSLSKVIQAVRWPGLKGTIAPKDSATAESLSLLLNPFEMAVRPRTELPSVFCSELVAAAYMVMGFISQNHRVPSMYIPRDFSSSCSERRALEFNHGIFLELEIGIDCDDLSLARTEDSHRQDDEYSEEGSDFIEPGDEEGNGAPCLT